jgi:uncharacterized protein (TIGR03118 family)
LLHRGAAKEEEIDMSNRRVLCSLVILTLGLLCPSWASAQHYTQTNLVSDTGSTPVTDSNLKNAWGLVHGPTTPWWISDNATGLSTLYDVSTTPVTIKPTVVTVPNAPSQTAPGNPTGIVFNGSATDFLLAPGLQAIFIWCTEDGTISGWNPKVNATTAIIKVDKSQKPRPDHGAVYKGLTITEINGQKFLLAANFRSGRIEVFDTAFKQQHISEELFDDDRIPRGFAPFNVQAVGPNIYVTYAKQDDAKHDDVPGAGFGFVDVYSRRGKLLQRLQHGPWLDSPWGVVLAPADFGEFSHALLIGNFGSGTIAAYNQVTGEFIGNMLAPDGTTLSIDGLWALAFGNGGPSGPGNTLFFTAGPNGETDGLFGTLTPISGELNENDEL